MPGSKAHRARDVRGVLSQAAGRDELHEVRRARDAPGARERRGERAAARRRDLRRVGRRRHC